MKYEKSIKYSKKLIHEKIMGPNPLKLLEELMNENKIPERSVIMDLGSGRGLTSVFLAKEYGFRVFATDLWTEPTDNMRFFESMGLSSEIIIPIKADALSLPYAHEFFDAVISIDAYHYFGHNEKYLSNHLLPFIKHGGYIYIAVPGMKKDCHDNLPSELLASWTPDELDTIHDAAYWSNIISKTDGIEIISIKEMETNDEAWNDWLECDNEYAKLDRKAMNSGGGKYMNFIAIMLKKK